MTFNVPTTHTSTSILGIITVNIDICPDGPTPTGTPPKCVAEIVIEVSTDPRHQRTVLDGLDVTAEIRTPQATAAVSPVSAVAAVRKKLVAQQRELIAGGPIVAEGRDIGSVVWPDAELKVFLTAS